MSDISDIKLNVEKIQKRFGGKTSTTKMPGGEDEELDLMELLLQGMGTALFGTYKKDEGGIKTLFQSKNISIYAIVKDIRRYIGETKKLLIDSKIPSIKTDISNIKQLTNENKSILEGIETGIIDLNAFFTDSQLSNQLNIDDFNKSVETFKTIIDNQSNGQLNIESLNTSIESLRNIINNLEDQSSKLNINIDDNGTIKDLNKFTEAIKNFNGSTPLTSFLDSINELIKIEKIDTNSLKEKIKTLNSIILDDKESSFQSLYSNINNLSNGIEIDESIKNISYVINAIISLLNINDIKTDSLYKLAFLTDNKGPISEIIKNIRKYSNMPTDVQKSIEILDDLFKSIVTISSIGFFKRKRIASNLQFINNYILKELPAVFDNIKTVSALSNDTVKSVENLGEIFKLLVEISDLKFTKKTRLIDNLDFIQNELLEKIKDLIENLYISTNEVTKNTNSILDSSQNIKNIIDTFLEISKIDDKEIDNIIYSIDYINDELIESIKKLLSSIESINTSQGLKNINDINFVFKSLNTILSQLPSIKNLILASIKLTSLKSLLENDIKDIIDFIVTLENIPKDKLDIFNKSLPALFSGLNSINAKLNIKDFIKIFKDIELFKQELVLLNDILKYVRKIKGITDFSTIKESFINDLITGLVDIEVQLDKMDFKHELENFQALIDELTIINKIVTIDKILAKNIQNIDYESIKEYIDNDLKLFIEIFSTNHDIGKNIKKLVKLDKKDLENIDTLISAFKSLSRLTKISVSSKLTEAGMKAMENAVDKMISIVDKIKEVENSDVEKAKDFIKSFMMIIAGSGAIMIFGALLMSKVKIADLILFTVSLTFFVGSILFAFKLFAKGIKSELEGAKDCLTLIAGAGLIMILGSLIINFIDPKDLLKFTITLGAFLFGVGLVFLVVGKGFNKIRDGAENAMIIIGGAALVMLFGALAYHYISFKDLAGFIFNLSFFIFGVGMVLWAVSKGIKSVKRTAEDFMTIIAGSTLIMLLGALAYHYIPFKDLFGFTLMLSLFITGVTLPFIFLNKFGKNALKGAGELAILVAVSGAVLLIGAKLLSPKDYLNLILFAVVLAAFTGGLLYIYKRASKEAPQAFVGAIAIALLTLIGGGLLLYAGMTIAENPDILKYAFLFGTGLLGYTFLTIKLAQMVSKQSGQLWSGLAAIGGVLLVTYAGIKVIEEICKVCLGKDGKPKENQWAALLKGIAMMYTVVIAIGAGAITLGLALTAETFGIGAAGLAVGLGIIWAIAEVADVTIGVIDHIYKTMQSIHDVKKVEKDMIAAIEVIAVVQDKIIETFGIKKTIKIAACSTVFKETAEMLSAIGKSIKDWADLRIVSKYDSKGNPIEYLSLGSSDFKKAAENIKAVLLALGTAIVETYDAAKDKGIFTDITGLELIDSPFARVIKAMRYMGPMLTSIAKGIKDWANMKIVSKYDKNGNPIEYMSLGSGDFTKAAKNIKEVLVNIGTAIVEVTKEHPDLFGDNIFTDSPAVNAAKAMKLMGDVLSTTAQAVSCYASGRFPIYDKDGKIVDYNIVGPNDIVSAKEKIKAVLTALGEAIVDVVKDPANADIFDDGMFTDSPAIVAAKAMEGMANAIDKMVDIMTKFKDLNLKEINLESVKEKIAGLLGDTLGIMRLFMAPKGEARKGLWGWTKSLFCGSQSIGDYINENMGDVTEATENIGKLVEAVVGVINKISSIGEIIIKNNENLAIIYDASFGSKLQNLFGVISLIDKAVNEVKIENKDELFELFSSYTDILDTLVKCINNFDSDSVTYLDLLEKGIIKLYSTTSKIENITAFKEYVADVKSFVEAINSLDINKLSSMNSLTESLNKLASKLGNMDDLVDVLANKVTAVLLELVNQLNHAERVIKNAHELQNRRKKLIEESVHKVKEIMKQNMIVKVGKLEEGDALGTPSGGGTQGGGNNSGGSGSYSGGTPELESPEEVTEDKKDKKDVSNLSKPTQKEPYSEKPLTAEEFSKLMRDHMKGWDG